MKSTTQTVERNLFTWRVNTTNGFVGTQARDWLADDIRPIFVHDSRRARDCPVPADDIHPIFVHDRGADALSFYIDVTEDRDEAGFVVRANQNRCTRTASGREDRLFE